MMMPIISINFAVFIHRRCGMVMQMLDSPLMTARPQHILGFARGACAQAVVSFSLRVLEAVPSMLVPHTGCPWDVWMSTVASALVEGKG